MASRKSQNEVVGHGARGRKPPGKGRFKDKYDVAAEHIVFDERGPFRKALVAQDDVALAEALSAELRELERILKRAEDEL